MTIRSLNKKIRRLKKELKKKEELRRVFNKIGEAIKTEYYSNKSNQEYLNQLDSVLDGGSWINVFEDVVNKDPGYFACKKIEDKIKNAKKWIKTLKCSNAVFVILTINVDGPHEAYSSLVSVSTTVKLVTRDLNYAISQVGKNDKLIRMVDGKSIDSHVETYGHSE